MSVDEKKKKPKQKPKQKPDSAYEEAQFKRLSGQVTSDIAKEKAKGTSSSEESKLGAQIQHDIGGEEALTAAGMGHHPDAKALLAAGIDPKRLTQLATANAPNHPATAGLAAANPNAGVGFSADPSTPEQYAADVLKESNLPDTKSNEQLLMEQMTVEGMPGSENNPLATSKPDTGSSSINSAGVQDYPSLAEGATAEAMTLMQPNMASIYDALKSGTATPQQYAAGLAGSSYEGSDPAANAAYANSFLKDAGQPEESFPGGGAGGTGGGGAYGGGTSDTTGAQAIANAGSSNLFAGLSNLFGGTAGSPVTANSLQQALSGLSSNPEAATETANTQNAPGSPDAQTPDSQKLPQGTQAPQLLSPAAYQAILSQLVPGITPGTAGKQ
jgi:hypothetical protein